MKGRVSNWIYLASLLPCAIAASIGVYLAVELYQAWPPQGEYGGLAPFVIGIYFGPAFLAAVAALLFGIRPGGWRLILTGAAAVWTILISPMLWVGGGV